MGTTPSTSTADYTIQAESLLAPRVFEHESFSVRSVVKSQIAYYPGTAEASKRTYESIWYSNGRPLGMERASTLDIPADKNVDIKIVQSPCASFDESKASANVIMRLALDILRNQDKVDKVLVPASSFTDILMQLQSKGAAVMPPGEQPPEAAKVKFKIESATTGMNQYVYFM